MPTKLKEVCIVEQELLCAYGRGVEHCAELLLAGKSALKSTSPDGSTPPVGAIPQGLLDDLPGSRFAALLRAGCDKIKIPRDAEIFLATTVGAIDELESAVLAGDTFGGQGGFSRLHELAAEALDVSPDRIHLVSSACASSTAALAIAASAIRHGDLKSALVIGADILSEFVQAGFSALMAVDPTGAHPFDAHRKGVALGEACAVALLMSSDQAARKNRPSLGIVAGWGLTCDANHLTGPSRDGAPLAAAIRSALDMASSAPRDVAAICAHGTGTIYNDNMEMCAFQSTFGAPPLPTFSVKGGMGHVLGAAGLAEVLLALEFLRRKKIPPTVALRQVAEEAAGWVSDAAHSIDSTQLILSNNSGFGGTNVAVVLSLAPRPIPKTSFSSPLMQTHGSASVSAAEVTPTAAEKENLPRNFNRFAPEVRCAYFVVRRALESAKKSSFAPSRVGIIASSSSGSEAANAAYFSDYVHSGRTLARGHLFAFTLPTSIAAECAIACQLTGPLLYLASEHDPKLAAEPAACRWIADATCDAVLILSTNQNITRATLWGKSAYQPKE